MIKRFIPYLEILGNELILDDSKPYRQTDAVELARYYESAGADEIMLIERSNYNDRSEKLISLVEKMMQELFLPISVSGGIDSVSKIRQFIRAGAVKTCISSYITKHPEFLQEASENIGAEYLSLLIIYRKTENSEYKVFSKSGKSMYSDVFKLIDFAQDYVSEIIVKPWEPTNNSGEIDLNFAQKLSENRKIPIIFGIDTNYIDKSILSDFFTQTQISGILAANIFHNPLSTILKLKRSLKQNLIPVRLSVDCLNKHVTRKTGQIGINLLESNPKKDSELLKSIDKAQEDEDISQY